ncbi:MAG: serine hydrolase [Chloroflexota bacterium]
MNKSSSPGLGQWLFVTATVVGLIFLLYKIYQYGAFRSYLPAGLAVGGVDVGGLTLDEAGEVLNSRYVAAPVVLHHGQDTIPINPLEIEFVLDLETMLNEADYQRSQQDFWSGFWGYLWGRPVEVEAVELRATHNRDALLNVIEVVASRMDKPAQPPQPVPTTLSFQYGEAGTQTNANASLRDVEAAFYRPTDREAFLIVEPLEPERPDINLLARLLVNHLQDFSGVASIFIMDLATGEEVAINADVAMSGMSIVKVPIVLETLRALDVEPSLEQAKLISETLVVQSGNFSANLLLDVVAGEDNAYKGADTVTESMRRLGLVNTFIAVPYEEQPRPGRATYETPANSHEGLLTQPDPAMQTTAEDIGTLLSMIYYCARDGSGALMAVYGNQLTQSECQSLLGYMAQNHIGSLIEEGVPEGTTVAHKHGWISDTHGDAGIVFSAGGDYVLVEYMYKPTWLEWEISSPLLADIARATYNYFNFDNPYLDSSQAN